MKKSELAQAILENNAVKIKALLEQGEDPNQMYDPQGTVFMFACARCNLEIVHLLLKHGANVHTKVGTATALRLACNRGDIDIVKTLLDNGADANEKIPSYLPEHPDRYKTPLQDAIASNSPEIVELLFSGGADVSIKDHYSLTALHNAAWLGFVDVVNVLLKNGAEIDAKTDDGETPLFLACRGGCGTPDEGRIDVVKILLAHGANPNQDSKIGEGLLEQAYDKKFKLDDIEIIKLLIQHGAEVSECDITYFSEQGHTDILDMIKQRN